MMHVEGVEWKLTEIFAIESEEHILGAKVDATAHAVSCSKRDSVLHAPPTVKVLLAVLAQVPIRAAF